MAQEKTGEPGTRQGTPVPYEGVLGLISRQISNENPLLDARSAKEGRPHHG